MSQDQLLAPRAVFDTALLIGANAARLQRLNTTMVGAVWQASQVQSEAAAQAAHDCITHFSKTAGDRDPVQVCAQWTTLTQANQRLMYSALKRSVEIVASAQQVAGRLMAEAVHANFPAAFMGGNRTLMPATERRIASVVIQFPDRRDGLARITQVSDTEVQMSAVIVS